LPPGRYQLLIGLYDQTDPTTRLLIRTEASTTDAYPVAAIFVE